MTVQKGDRFIYKGELHTFDDFCGIPFGGIRRFGLAPIMISTACRRGYVAMFALDSENRLLLKSLLTNNGGGESKIHPINGVLPICIKPDGVDSEYTVYRYLEYNEINLPIECSGKVKIMPIADEYQVGYSANFRKGSVSEEQRIRRLFLDWHPVDGANSAIELVFADGMCINVTAYGLKYVPEELKTSELCLEAVSQCGDELQFVPDKLKTMDLCLAAVQENAWAHEYVPDALKTQEFWLAAFQNNVRRFWPLLPDELKTPELCCIAVHDDAKALELVPEPLKTMGLCLAAVTKSGRMLQYVPEPLITAEICLAAVNNDAWAFQFVPEAFKTQELCLVAVTQRHSGGMLEYVPDKLKTSDLCLAAVKNDGSAFKYVPKELKTEIRRRRLP